MTWINNRIGKMPEKEGQVYSRIFRATWRSTPQCQSGWMARTRSRTHTSGRRAGGKVEIASCFGVLEEAVVRSRVALA